MEDPDGQTYQTQYHDDNESVGRSSGVRVTPAGIRGVYRERHGDY